MASTVTQSRPLRLQPVAIHTGLTEHDSLAVMLKGSSEILACIHREQKRLRLLVAQGTATSHQIVPLLARLEALATHNRHIDRQLQWLCQDMQRSGLAPTPPTRRPTL